MTIEPRDRERSVNASDLAEDAIEVEYEIPAEEISEGEILQEENIVTIEPRDRERSVNASDLAEDSIEVEYEILEDKLPEGEVLQEELLGENAATTENSLAMGVANHHTTMIQISCQAARDAIDLQNKLTVEHQTLTSQQLQRIFGTVCPLGSNHNPDIFAFVIQALEKHRS
ncbi:MAG: hypothetical protein J7647_11845 [Cyanobacteria bacterium SBLK]|nr:hypothetical protein [Cyanobacteria bacterium SBLK]